MNNLQLKQTDVTGSTFVKINAPNVLVSGSRTTVKTPNANMDGTIQQVQTQSINNPKYVINNVLLSSGSGYLTYAQILSLYRTTFSGSNPAYLKVIYGDSDTQLIDSQGTALTDGIPVILESFSFNVDNNDSRKAYLPKVNLTFTETKVS